MTIPKHHRSQNPHGTVVTIGNNTHVGGDVLPIIAGPCAVESLDQLLTVGQTLVKSGLTSLRAGAYKPRTSPYNFQGMGEDGLKLLAQVRDDLGVNIVSEVMAIDQIAIMAPYVDCYQVGARNMQNFDLLKALGRQQKPVLLKRGLSATIEEFLWCAEYILSEGNPNVILCERGIRSFDTKTRNVLDLASVALLKELTHLPIIVDPSHATGKRSLIAPCSKAAVAVGADGLIVEAHPVPDESVSDAAQALSLPALAQLVQELKPMAAAVGKTIECHGEAATSTMGEQLAEQLGIPQSELHVASNEMLTHAVRALHSATHKDANIKKGACA